MIYYRTLIFSILFFQNTFGFANELLIAAASDMKFAMHSIVEQFRATNPQVNINVAFGASGKFRTQIQHGAPYDLYFSADITYPQHLASSGLAASPVIPYARGKLVMLSRQWNINKQNLNVLQEPRFKRVAIASPKHAPYGIRAKEVLVAQGLWSDVSTKLVFGDSVAHATQFVINRHVDVGIVALSLVKSPTMPKNVSYALIPDALYQPLIQGMMVTATGENNPAAWAFFEYIQTEPVARTLQQFGFTIPVTDQG